MSPKPKRNCLNKGGDVEQTEKKEMTESYQRILKKYGKSPKALLWMNEKSQKKGRQDSLYFS